MTTEHVFEKHEHCAKAHCAICHGGLQFCIVCKCGEASLATECPASPCGDAIQDRIMSGTLDFVGGKWVSK